ncbi:MAG: hypothetical protein IJ935_00975 [Afipia sp.]|nr:hypothetical protein [Afipia sp.]
MSGVTGLVLVCSLMDGDPAESSNVHELNSWLKHRGFGELVDVAQHSGGTKHPEMCMFCCGYNDFPENHFAEIAMSMNWMDPESVVLIMQPDEGSTRVIRPCEFDC